MNARTCATCGAAFETDLINETICPECDRSQWLDSQQRLEVAMADRRRAKMQAAIPAETNETPCATCGYLFDFGSNGARMCPNCMAQDQFDMQGATTIASAYAWLMAKLNGKPTIH